MERLFHPPKIIFLISPKSMWAELGNGQVWRAREGFGKFPPPLVDPPLEPESPIDEREGRTDSIQFSARLDYHTFLMIFPANEKFLSACGTLS